jgi:CRISPR-associated endonuclease Csn1
MARRQLRRRRERRRALNECLTDAGLLPRFGTAAWDEAMTMDPVDLRARALDKALTPHELGRALYHMAKRRHFAERAPGEGADDLTGDGKQDAEEKKAQSARETFLQELRQTGETIGQRLAIRKPPLRQRGLHANRAAVSDEYERLWRAQTPYHAALQEPTLRARVEALIFDQRPVFWRTATLGTCRLMPGEPPCPRGSWLSQQRRLLEKLNNLSIVGGNGRPLDEAERAAILGRLEAQNSVSWAGVRRARRGA